MKRATKTTMSAVTLPFAALPLALGGSAPAAAAAMLIPDGPATVLHHSPTPWSMKKNLGGALCEAPKVCREVYYDWIQPYGLIEIGVAPNVRRIDAAIKRTDGPKIVYAFSGGARDASVWLDDHADDADAPGADDLSFVLIGNGGRKYGGVNGWAYGDLLSTPTDTQYDVLDIAREYDPIADFPANPFNLLALANAAAAFDYVHMKYDEVDLDNPDNIVWTEGKTTYVFAPTEHLPLLQGFYNAGLGWMVEGLEPKLRESIDKAYNRTWLEGKAPQGPASELSSSQEASSSAPTALSAAESDENTGGDESSPEAGTNTSGATGESHSARAGGASKRSVTSVASGSDDPTDTVPTPASDDTPAPADRTNGAPAGAGAADAGDQAAGGIGEDGEGAGSSASVTKRGDTPTRGRHSAPLHGTKKAKSASSASPSSAGGDGNSDSGSASTSTSTGSDT